MPTLTPFAESYIEKLFQLWFDNNCPTPSKLKKILDGDRDQYKDAEGRIPSENTLNNWMIERGWWMRKDAIDARVATQIDDELVAQKVNMLREQAAQFREIRNKAVTFLMENEFDSSASAVSALIKSAQEERIARGLSKTIQDLAQMDNDSLLERVKKLALKETSGEIIDVAEPETGEEEDESQE